MKVATLETKVLNAAKDVKAGIEEAGDDAVKLAVFLENNSAKITALASLAGPGAAKATQIGAALLNLAITAVKDAGAAASANGVSITLDQATLADVKGFVTAVEKI